MSQKFPVQLGRLLIVCLRFGTGFPLWLFVMHVQQILEQSRMRRRQRHTEDSNRRSACWPAAIAPVQSQRSGVRVGPIP
jgi:hypothetical protein